MENSTTKRLHFLVRLSSALWRAFRKAPLIMQSLIVATAAGTVLVGVFVGNMGLTLIGTAIARGAAARQNVSVADKPAAESPLLDQRYRP